MLSNEEMIGLQAEKHELINTEKFSSEEEYVLHLMHTFAYEHAAKLGANKRVLDLGCNTGYGSKIISETCKEIIGVDVSSKAISIAKSLYGDSKIRFELIDGKRLPFIDNTFDVVISFQVIEHLVTFEDYMSEIQRVLVPGGLVLFTTPNGHVRLDPGMKPWNPFHVREFLVPQLETLLNNYFPNVKVYGMFAKEPLYSIELNRMEKGRKHAKEQQKHETSNIYRFRRKLINFLPDSVIKYIREYFLSKKSHKKETILSTDFQNQYRTDYFHYSEDNLEKSLDLLAICMNEK